MADDDRNLDAGERALGTLPDEGGDAEARRLQQEWDMRLAPLLDAADPVTPPPGLLGRIESDLDREALAEDLSGERRRVRRWQGVAALAGSVAAALAIWVAVPGTSPAPRYVAVVSSDADGTPGMIVQVDTASGVATVIPLVGAVPEGRSLEMWQLPVGAERPFSLGLLPQDASLRTTVKAGVGDTFAISFEPEGGSPTGQPTDARYHGKIILVE